IAFGRVDDIQRVSVDLESSHVEKNVMFCNKNVTKRVLDLEGNSSFSTPWLSPTDCSLQECVEPKVGIYFNRANRSSSNNRYKRTHEDIQATSPTCDMGTAKNVRRRGVIVGTTSTSRGLHNDHNGNTITSITSESADNRPLMLEKDMYDSWKSRIELYMLNHQHGRMILESVEQGPLLWPFVEVEGVTRLKKYSELSAAEAIQADCDVKATNIILQGLPPEKRSDHVVSSPVTTFHELIFISQ
nr:hypothetical protein [Tanacetum cinerariifolium]